MAPPDRSRVRRVLSAVVCTAALAVLPGCFPLWGWDTGVSSSRDKAASNVRAAVPAIEAWYADRGTYAGMTVDKLNARYNAGLADVRLVGPLDRRTYCVESTTEAATYSKRGPEADILPVRCEDFPAPPPPSLPTLESEAAQNVYAAMSVFDAHYTEHGTYDGITVQDLRRFLPGIETLVIVEAGAESFCVESTVGSETWSARGPSHDVGLGPCKG
jgi:hypothetical protein